MTIWAQLVRVRVDTAPRQPINKYDQKMLRSSNVGGKEEQADGRWRSLAGDHAVDNAIDAIGALARLSSGSRASMGARACIARGSRTYSKWLRKIFRRGALYHGSQSCCQACCPGLRTQFHTPRAVVRYRSKQRRYVELCVSHGRMAFVHRKSLELKVTLLVRCRTEFFE